MVPDFRAHRNDSEAPGSRHESFIALFVTVSRSVTPARLYGIRRDSIALWIDMFDSICSYSYLLPSPVHIYSPHPDKNVSPVRKTSK
jgi:hypothetical protein